MPTHFAVVPDERHVFADVERVVERHDRYWVVEKSGAAARSVSSATRVRPSSVEERINLEYKLVAIRRILSAMRPRSRRGRPS